MVSWRIFRVSRLKPLDLFMVQFVLIVIVENLSSLSKRKHASVAKKVFDAEI